MQATNSNGMPRQVGKAATTMMRMMVDLYFRSKQESVILGPVRIRGEPGNPSGASRSRSYWALCGSGGSRAILQEHAGVGQIAVLLSLRTKPASSRSAPGPALRLLWTFTGSALGLSEPALGLCTPALGCSWPPLGLLWDSQESLERCFSACLVPALTQIAKPLRGKR